LDPHASPSSVFPTKPNDQVDEIIAHRRPPGTSLFSPSAPLVLGGFPMPAEQRVGRDQERLPTRPREQSAERGKNGSIRWPVPDPSMELALENPDLVAKDYELDVLIGFASPTR
jgi:hypothetical protein